MKLRYHFWQSLLFLGVLVCVLLSVYLSFSDKGVNRANFQRIEIGMTKDEVSQVFGRPADWRLDTKGYVFSPLVFGSKTGRKERDYQLYRWESPNLLIDVIFDQRDEVACRYTIDIPWWVRVQSFIRRGR
jgi:hypothetical protein